MDKKSRFFNQKKDIISYTFWATKARKVIRRYNYGSKKNTRQNVLCRFQR